MITDSQINEHIDKIDSLRDRVKNGVSTNIKNSDWDLTKEERKILLENSEFVNYLEEKLNEYRVYLPVNDIRSPLMLKAIAQWLLYEVEIKQAMRHGVEWSKNK